MARVIERLFPQILLIHQKSLRRLGGCHCLSSKTVLSNMPLLLKWDDKEYCIPEKKDPFKLLLDSNLIHKKFLTKRLPVTLLNVPQPPETKRFLKNNHHEEFIEWIDKQSNFGVKSEQFENQISSLLANLHSLNGEQLIKIINWLYLITEKSKQVECLVAKLDQECCNRSTKWDKKTYFAAAWGFFQLKSYTALQLQKKIIIDLADAVKQMTSQELVMYLVILKQFRRFPKRISIADIENRLSEVLDNLSTEDLGLVCLAFFECNEAIKNTDLVGRLVERLLTSASSADEKTVGSMLKLFRRSSLDPANFAKQILGIQPRLCDLVHLWNPKVLIQLIAVGSNVLHFHHTTIERVTQKFLTCMNEARLKDVERLAMAIAISCHQSPSGNLFWDVIEKEFTTAGRRYEIHRYPNAFISLVNYAIIANHYSEQLVRMALNPDFVGIAKSKHLDTFQLIRFYILFYQLAFSEQLSYNSTRRELLHINCSLNIERPGYDGPKLCTKDAQAFEKVKKDFGNITLALKLNCHFLALQETYTEC